MNNILYYIAESITEACFEIADYIVETTTNFWNNNQWGFLIVFGGLDFMMGSVLLNNGSIVF